MNILKKSIKSIAIGGFDGMHLAHQQLFTKLCKNGAIVVIETSYANLSPKHYREQHSSYPIYYYDLDSIKHLSGEMFVNLLIEEFPSLDTIVVGYDFRFGYKASCSIYELKSLFRGDVVVVDEYKLDGVSIHSRSIREYISLGEIKKVNKFLGYNYTIVGKHIKGQGLGSKSFVPTINIYVEQFLIPKDGVYITYTILDDISYPSITFIGKRDTTDCNFAIETHILVDITSCKDHKNISIEFIEYIRENRKFTSFDALKREIDKNIEKSKKFFRI